MQNTVLSTIAIIALTLFSAIGRTAPSPSLPKVVVLELGTSPQAADGIFRAIRAQLSGAMLTLERARVETAVVSDPSFSIATAVPRAAAATGAAMVLWVEDGEPCRVSFFIPSATGGRFLSRALEMDPSTGSGRFEVIGIATAGMVEGLLISHRSEIQAAQALPVSPTPETNPPEAAPPLPSPRKNNFELSAAYAGLYFTKNTFGHGIRLGLGLLPIDFLMINVQFRFVFPMRFSDDLLQLTILSRTLSVSAAGRIQIKNVEIRLGAAYTVDLRSFSTAAENEPIELTRTGFDGIHGVAPFLTAVWVVQKRFGLFVAGGADIAVKETDYKIKVNGVETMLVSPFTAKATVEAGFVIQI